MKDLENGGVLQYKCRRCGKVSANTHIPKGSATIILTCVLNNYEILEKIRGVPASQYSICNCNDGNLGVSDLIGLEFD